MSLAQHPLISTSNHHGLTQRRCRTLPDPAHVPVQNKTHFVRAPAEPAQLYNQQLSGKPCGIVCFCKPLTALQLPKFPDAKPQLQIISDIINSSQLSCSHLYGLVTLFQAVRLGASNLSSRVSKFEHPHLSAARWRLQTVGTGLFDGLKHQNLDPPLAAPSYLSAARRRLRTVGGGGGPCPVSPSRLFS